MRELLIELRAMRETPMVRVVLAFIASAIVYVGSRLSPKTVNTGFAERLGAYVDWWASGSMELNLDEGLIATHSTQADTKGWLQERVIRVLEAVRLHNKKWWTFNRDAVVYCSSDIGPNELYHAPPHIQHLMGGIALLLWERQQLVERAYKFAYGKMSDKRAKDFEFDLQHVSTAQCYIIYVGGRPVLYLTYDYLDSIVEDSDHPVITVRNLLSVIARECPHYHKVTSTAISIYDAAEAERNDPYSQEYLDSIYGKDSGASIVDENGDPFLQTK